MAELCYKKNFNETIARLKALYSRSAADQVFASFSIPSRALTEFAEHNPEGYCTYPDLKERVAFWDSYLKERSLLEDDSIPAAYMSEFDQGLYGGLLGGEVRFIADPALGRISSMVAPVIENWSQLETLKIDRDHPWFERYIHQLKLFTDGSRGNFGISHFIMVNHLNLGYELVGATETYMGMIDRPETVKEAIEFAFELNVLVQNTFFELVPLIAGGTCSNMAQWLPGRIVSESLDPFHMTSVHDFEQWGRDPVERVCAQFDGGIAHIHANGRHLLEAACTLNGLKAIFMIDDRGYPTGFDIRHELRQRAGDVPLVLPVEYQSFVEQLEQHKLSGGIFYRVSGAPDIDSANRCMEKVREYRV